MCWRVDALLCRGEERGADPTAVCTGNIICRFVVVEVEFSTELVLLVTDTPSIDFVVLEADEEIVAFSLVRKPVVFFAIDVEFNSATWADERTSGVDELDMAALDSLVDIKASVFPSDRLVAFCTILVVLLKTVSSDMPLVSLEVIATVLFATAASLVAFFECLAASELVLLVRGSTVFVVSFLLADELALCWMSCLRLSCHVVCVNGITLSRKFSSTSRSVLFECFK